MSIAAQLLPFHPFAGRFPLLNGAEFKEFVADVAANGLQEPITLYRGAVLDGRNRYRACVQLKLEPRFEEFKGDDAAAFAYVFSKNIHRRHLKTKDKRDAIAALLKIAPEKSDRQIAEMVKVDHKTVAPVRAEQEGRGEIPHVKTRTDTKGRKQVVGRIKPPAKPKRRPVEDFQRDIEAKQATAPPPCPAIEAAKNDISPAIPEPLRTEVAVCRTGQQLETLRELARFIISERGCVTTDPGKDRAAWNDLFARVKAAMGGAS
jgi:ParB-like chromosome segregation protein Spo0J